MANTLGSFCLVLHGHLPYVLRHGTWPHGEDWLYEAAAETYLPLLAMIDEARFLKATPRMTMGLTPVLLEQLAHPHFKDGFVKYLDNRIDRARKDKAEFEKLGHGHMVYLAERWETVYTELKKQFDEIDQDIPAAYAARSQKDGATGEIELLTSNATHAYTPLLLEDASIRGQTRAGLAASEKRLGLRPTGMWLPECAYRPSGPWTPPIPWGGTRAFRCGTEHLVADEGITHFFVEAGLITGCKSEFVRGDDGHWHKVSWDQATQDPGRGWRSVHEPHGVNSDGEVPPRVAAWARDPKVCEQVWSGDIGYPAAGEYLEFHKKWSPRRGLRYWKITGPKVGLGDKHLYYPDDDVKAKLYEHVSHFCGLVKQRLHQHREQTGRAGAVVCCFDAELFGHWWAEGPTFLRDVMLSLSADPEVQLQTTAEYLEDHPVDKCVTMPEGSWGEEGDHRVWANDQINWMWEIEYRCEATFGRLTSQLPWGDHAEVREVLEKAGRELLLLQASDWPFVIRRGQAVDYGTKRFMQHVGRFESLVDIAERLVEDGIKLADLTEVEQHQIKDANIHDVVFPEIDLHWWDM